MADEEKPGEEPEVEESREKEPSEAETKAIAQGWAPKDKWKGPEEKWVDADTFLERGEKIAPIQAKKIERLEGELDDIKRKFADFGGWRDKVEKNAHERALKDIKSRQREAVKSMDSEAFEAAEKDAEKLNKEVEQKAEERKPDAWDTAAAKWKAENDWFEVDSMLTEVAGGIHVALRRTKPGLTPEQNLAETLKEVKRRFPEKFETESPRREAPHVEGSSTTRSRNGAKGYADLPADAKIAGTDFVKRGIYTDREQYAKDYFAMEDN